MQNLGLKMTNPYSGKSDKRRRSASSIGNRSKSSPKKRNKQTKSVNDKKELLKL